MMLEKVERIEKRSNRLAEMLSTKTAKYIVGTAILSGIGIALPRIFHVLAGSTAGSTFLPMHIAVLIAALVFGIRSATIVSGSSVIFSYLLTGMPSLARLPYMLIELVIYGILLSVFNKNLTRHSNQRLQSGTPEPCCIGNKKFNSYVSLIGTIILGRVLYSGVLFAAINVLGLPTYGISVIQSMVAGLPGIAIQLICVPFIAKAIKKGIKLDD